MKIHTHYDNLKVTQDAPAEVIKAAYRALASKYHPDKNGGSARAKQIMALINTAYAVLSDPSKKAAHDLWIREQIRKRGKMY